MKQLLIAGVCGLALAGVAGEAVTTLANTWQTMSGEGLNGSWSTVGHWKLGHLPKAGEVATFRNLSDSASVTMPEGTFASPAGIRVGVTTGTSVTLDFSKTVYTEPGFYVGTTPSYSMWLDINPAQRAFLPQNNSGYTGVMTSISGAVVKVERPTDTTGSITFTGGSYNFYDPEGSEIGNSIAVFGQDTTMTDVDIVFDGTSTRLPTLALNGCVPDGRLKFLSSRHELLSTLTFADVNGRKGTNTVEVGAGATVSLANEVIFQSGAGNDSLSVQAGGTFMVTNDNLKIYAPSGKRGIVNIDGGTVRVSKSSSYFYANDNDGTMDFNLRDGLVDLTGSLGLLLPRGQTTFTVSGGELRASCIYLGMRKASGTPTLIQTGGTIYQTGDVFSISHSAANTCACHLQLDGGVAVVKQIVKGSGSGTAMLSANGGTLRAREANATLISGFDSAKLGEKGLVIDTTNYDAWVPQSFTDADDAEGKGLLIKRGTGTLVFQGASAPSRIRVEEGHLRLDEGADAATELEVLSNSCVICRADLSATPLKGLTLGGDGLPGRLRISKNAKIVVDGPLVINDARVWLDGTSTWEIGDVATVLTTTTPLSEANAAAWIRALESNGTADRACRFSVEPSGTGSALKVTVAAPETVELRVDEYGVTSNAVEDLAYAANDALKAVVTAGSQVNASGAYRFGTFTKEGAGRVVLSNAGNSFENGVTLSSGLLSVPTLEALGLPASGSSKLFLNGGTLAVGSEGTADFGVKANAGSKTAYVVKTDADVAFPMPALTSGDLVKRGAGTLTYLAHGTGVPLTLDNGVQPNGKTAPGAETITFDADGTPPTGGYAGLNIVEGTLRVKGEGKTSTNVKLENLVYVGLPVKDLASQPGLVFEDCTVTTASAGQSIELGSGAATSDNTDVRATSLAMTNVVFGSLPILRVGYTAKVALDTVISLDNSHFTVPNFYPCQQGSSHTVLKATNKSRLSVATVFSIGGETKMTFDDSRLDGGGDNAVMPSVSNGKTLTMDFMNGAELVMSYASGSCVLSFDNAFWNLGVGIRTNTFDSAARTVEVRAGGVHVAPAAGDAWTFTSGFTGEGAVSVEGEGTVGFVEAAASGLKLGGSGTVANSALTDLTICCDPESGEAPHLTFSNCTLPTRATVDLGRTTSKPLTEPFEPIVVATFVGERPDVTSFRLRGTGVANIHGTFVYDENGRLVVTPKRTGALIVFR